MTSEVRWQKQRRGQIAAAAAAGATIVQPIGAIEQHGPHLPLDTDSAAVAEVCERAARRAAGPPALVLPTIAWGLSPYWLPFPGTLSLRPETILALVSDIGASVARHGFRRLVIVNGHGGNAGIVAVCATLLADHGLRATSLSWWSLLGAELASLAPGDAGHIGHAGQTETSVQLAVQPEYVDHAAVDASQCGDLAAMRSAPFAGVGYAPPLPEVEAPHGVYGDAPAATAEIGAAVLDRAAERLAAFLADFAAEPLPPDKS
jgi:creatinine amidohydrolase